MRTHMTLCVYRDRLESASVSVAVGSTCFPIGHPLDPRPSNQPGSRADGSIELQEKHM